MSLFVCEGCRCIENTATSRFWRRELVLDGKALCSECDPGMEGWHGRFEKTPYDPEQHEPAYMDGEWLR